MQIRNDIRMALRSLRKAPGLSLAAILSLGFGIGVNTAAFSVVYPVLLSPLPYDDPERLVLAAETNEKRGYDWFPVAPQNYQRIAELEDVFEDIAAIEGWTGALSGSERAATIRGMRSGRSLFRMLGVEPVMGRAFVPDDDESVVILSDGFWRDQLGSDPDILNKAIVVDKTPLTVVGVLPSSFQFATDSIDAWRPVQRVFDERQMTYHGLRVVAKLRPGVGVEQANSRLATLMEHLAEQSPKTNAGWSARVKGLQQFFIQRDNAASAMVVISAAVGFILLMACINVANLQLARSSARAKELAIRSTLGAPRSLLVRQLLTESTVLSLIGGALGFVLAYWSMSGIRQILPRLTLFDADALEMDWTTAGFTLGISVLTAVVFGILPALRASKLEPARCLHEGSRSVAGGVHSNRFHNMLVVSEIALALLVLTGTGLMLSSFQRLQNVEKGFRSDGLLTMRISLLDYNYRDEAGWPRYYSDALARAREVPGVLSAAAIDLLPMRSTAGWFFDFLIEGRPTPDGAWPNAASRTVTPGYFATMGIPLLRGRDFTEQDDENAPGVVIIDGQMAKQYFPNENPVGQRLRLASRDPEIQWLEIVGVVAPVRLWSFGTEVFGKEADTMATVYRPLKQLRMNRMSVVIRTGGDPAAIAGAVQDNIWTIDKDQPITGVRSMDDYILRAHSSQQFNLIMAGIFGMLALLLAVSGIYGVMSYTVYRRSHELGVRMALGARRADIFRLVLVQAMRLTAIGLGLGLIASVVLTRFLAGMLYEISPTDIPTLAAVTVFLAVTALLASYRPAVRATGFDPLENLRAD